MAIEKSQQELQAKPAPQVSKLGDKTLVSPTMEDKIKQWQPGQKIFEACINVSTSHLRKSSVNISELSQKIKAGILNSQTSEDKSYYFGQTQTPDYERKLSRIKNAVPLTYRPIGRSPDRK